MATPQSTPPKTPVDKSPRRKGLTLSNDQVEVWEKLLLNFRKKPDKRTEITPAQRLQLIRKTLQDASADVQALWDIYTKDRDQIHRALSEPKRQRSAYLAGFHLANVARSTALFERFVSRWSDSSWQTLFKAKSRQGFDVLDLGCGTGAFSHAFAHFLKLHGLDSSGHQWFLQDQTATYIEAAAAGLLESGVSEASIRSVRGDVAQWQGSKGKLPLKDDLTRPLIVLMGNITNEIIKLPRILQAWQNLIKHFASLSRPVLIFSIEPVSNGFAMEMMKLRDQWVDDLQLKTIYPCPTRSDACPLLARNDTRKDYCYSEFNWDPPHHFEVFCKILGLERHNLASSAYVFANRAASEHLVAKASPDTVVVGRPTMKTTKVAPVRRGKSAAAAKTPEASSPQEFDYLLCKGDRVERLQRKSLDSGLKLRGECL